MGDSFFGFRGVNDLVLRRSDIVPVEKAMEIRLSPLTGVKDLLEPAKELTWLPEILGETEIENEVFAIIATPELLEDSWLDDVLTDQLTPYEQLELLSEMFDALDQVPTLQLIDFLVLLTTKYANHPVAGDIVNQLLDRYNEHSNYALLRLIAPLNDCLDGLLDICLLQGPPSCFQYYFYQATAISKAWAKLIQPNMVLSELRGIGNYQISAALFNLWSLFIGNAQKIMKEEACFNLWSNLSDVLPLERSDEMNMAFQAKAAQLQSAIVYRKFGTDRLYSVLDDQGIEFSFGSTSFFCNDITTYWVELTHLTVDGDSILLKFAACRPFEFVLAQEGSQEVLSLMSQFACIGLYKRWCGCLRHNLPIQFGDIIIKNEGIECDDTSHPWDEIELKVKEDKLYMYFFEYEYGVKISAEFACFDLIESPNAFMLEPLQEAVKICQAEPDTTFLEAWCRFQPHYAINFDLPKDNEDADFISKYIQKA